MKNKHFLLSILLLLTLPALLPAIEHLTLSQARDLAIRNNYDIQIADQNAQSTHQEKKAAFTNFLPSVNAAGTYLRLNKQIKYETGDFYLPVTDESGNVIIMTDENGVPILDANGNYIISNYAWLPSQTLKFGEKDNYLGTVSVTQPLFTGGKVYENYQVAKYLDLIGSQKKNLTRQEVICQVDEGYWRVIALSEKVKLAKQYKATVENHLQDLQNYYEEGVITNNDLLKVKVKLNEAELDLLKANDGYSLSLMALNHLLGLPLQDQTILLDSLTVETETQPVTSNLVEKALSQRPEISILKDTKNVSNSLVKISRSRYFPNLVLQGNYSWINPNPYNSFQDEFGGDWSVALVFEMELFHWNERGYELSAAKHARKAAELKLAQTEEQIKLQVSQEQYKLDEAAVKVKLTHQNVIQSKENMDNTADKFKEGMTTSSEVLDAQTLWQSAVSEFIDAKAEFKLQQTVMEKVLGNL